MIFVPHFQVSRLKGQVTRYKNQVKELEEREDELMKEKRQQGKEVCVCEDRRRVCMYVLCVRCVYVSVCLSVVCYKSSSCA